METNEIEMFLYYPALQGYMAFKMSYFFLYTCVARQCEFTIEVINLKQLPQSFCGLGGLCAAYSPHICYNNLSDQFSDVPHLLELIGGIYILGSSLTMKSGSLKYIQRTSKKKYK